MFEFFIAALVVAIAPGPDNLFVLAQSATHGTRAGICVICGLCTGIAVQTTLLIVGVSALIAASPVAFFVLQCCGAAYLLYLAYKSFQVRAGVVKLDERRETRESSGLSFRKLYLRGIIMNLTNPKAVLFALSFIPPAVRMDSALSPSLQMAILGVEFVVATFIVFGSIALLAGTVKNFLLNSPKANRNLNWFSGCVFVLLAIALFVM
ncbi:LysE family translocator [uncultured Fibrobacter sp.]|uniref:LysE family translocator n=1 Tax=uncultured Fibrobacter sp. TaxID=261512 RepID=UPI0025FEC512|nr:LysE family translocator [uncultured Fibrobacter sp.]